MQHCACRPAAAGVAAHHTGDWLVYRYIRLAAGVSGSTVASYLELHPPRVLLTRNTFVFHHTDSYRLFV